MSDITNVVSALVSNIAAAASRAKVNRRLCRQLATECRWIFDSLESGELGLPTHPTLRALVTSLEDCLTDLTKFNGSGYFVRWLTSESTADICGAHTKNLERWLSRIPQEVSDRDLDLDEQEVERYEAEVSNNLYNAGRILGSDIPSKVEELAIVNPDHLTVGKEVGTFPFGVVCAGMYNKKPVYVRMISEDFDRSIVDLIKTGILLNRCLLDCNNIVSVHGICQERMIVTDTAAYGQLNEFPIADTQQKVVIARKIADAMMFMHDIAASNTRVVHRDIRAANILLDSGPDGLEPKITGFEMCKEGGKLSKVYPTIDEHIQKWWAPERIKGHGTSTKTDIYAFGVLMYEISTGKEPEADLDLLREEGGRICREYTRLMEKCLHPHFDSRPNMDQVVDELLSMEKTLAMKLFRQATSRATDQYLK